MILIKIKNKGNKGSWFNKYVNNFFLAEPQTEVFEIKCLSNIDKDKLDSSYCVFDGLVVPRDNIEVMEKPRTMGIKGIVSIN